MSQSQAHAEHRAMKRRWGFVFIPTCSAIVAAEVVFAISAIVPPVIAHRAKQRRALVDAVAEMGGFCRVRFTYGVIDNVDPPAQDNAGADPPRATEPPPDNPLLGQEESAISFSLPQDWLTLPPRWSDEFQDFFEPVDFITLGQTDGNSAVQFRGRPPRARRRRGVATACQAAGDCRGHVAPVGGHLGNRRGARKPGGLDQPHHRGRGVHEGVASRRGKTATAPCRNARSSTFRGERPRTVGPFNPKDYRTLESFLFLTCHYTSPVGLSGIPMTTEQFRAELSRRNNTLADVDLDVLSDGLKSEIIFYRKWEAAAALHEKISSLFDSGPAAVIGWLDEEAFRTLYAEAFKRHCSAVTPHRYERIGVSFDFNINDGNGARLDPAVDSLAQLMSTAHFFVARPFRVLRPALRAATGPACRWDLRWPLLAGHRRNVYDMGKAGSLATVPQSPARQAGPTSIGHRLCRSVCDSVNSHPV